MNDAKFDHICESCGATATISSAEAYQSGWDYPPTMGAWGVVSPRTCPSCGIATTLWWAMATEKKSINELTPAQRKTLARILSEIDVHGAEHE